MVRICVVAPGRLGSGRGHPGRGAWLCPELSCVDKALRSRSIERGLRQRVGIDDSALREQLELLVGLSSSHSGRLEDEVV
jgi:predicted RNA-binding protein YlxR (DUF448 family)